MGLNKLKKSKVAVVAFIFFFVFSTTALASYIYSVVLNNYTATSEEFYFTSDLLVADSSTPPPIYYLSNDWQSSLTAVITFKLRNYNSTLNISHSRIAYSVTATSTSGSTSSSTGTIEADGPQGNEVPISLTMPVPADINSPFSVTITATSTSPYNKILKGIFVIKPALAYSMDSNAGSPIARLTIALEKDSSTTLNRVVTISWSAGASPDMTNPMVINGTINLVDRTLTTTLNKAAVYELIFFKDNATTSSYTGVTVT